MIDPQKPPIKPPEVDDDDLSSDELDELRADLEPYRKPDGTYDLEGIAADSVRFDEFYEQNDVDSAEKSDE